MLTDVGVGQSILLPEKDKKDARCPLLYYTIPSIRTTDSSYIPIDFLSQEGPLSAMKSPGLVSPYEKRDFLNTRVFSPNTKTGVQAATSTSVSSGLFKFSELQKEVTPKNPTTSYGNVNFPDARVDGQ